jgi:DsbC/DsbD-like thiol-disulfide interchange protein/cytochrome c biogenesis protein CcdA
MIAFGFRLLAFLALALAGPPAIAQTFHIRPALVAESSHPAAGTTTTVALVMKTEPGWHGYWKNPGDSGFETEIDWRLPTGVTASPLRYPMPDAQLITGLMSYVYEGDYAPLLDITVPPGLAAGTPLAIRAHLRWLACTREICVPEQGDIALDLTVGDGAPDAGASARFDAWRAALPRPLGTPGHFQTTGDRFRIAVPLPASITVDKPYFFALTKEALTYSEPQTISRNGDMLIVEGKAGNGSAGLSNLDGVIRIGAGNGLAVTATPGVVPAAGTPIASGARTFGGSALALLLALGGAILGGLILNVMPCVFPILSLKALGFARAGGDERGARHEALAYTAGAVLICAGLGLVLIALKASGSAAGWAFQLQDSRVILVLLLLVSAIALNLAGLFELPAVTGGSSLAARGGPAGAFWTGALAAFVATPCTGPFMGVALGAALVLPPAAALAVFAGLGFGLALPFLLLGYIPALRRRLPRPGPWMGRLRRILALPMLVTALGLAWVLGRLGGVEAMTLGLAATLLLAIMLWWVGRRQEQGKTRIWWPLVPAALAALALVPIVPRGPAAAAATTEGLPGTEPFSEARLAALQQEQRPVFVYFTADWCLTCKVNEKAAIERSEVADAFKAHNVAVLVGDWTRGDPAITRFLAAHGRSGVPFYLYYTPGGALTVLPQVLTPSLLAGLAA